MWSLEKYVLVFVFSFGLSLAVTPLVRKLAIRTGRVAVPKDNRWHRKETALLGGVGIFFSCMVVWIAGTFFAGWAAYGHPFLALMVGAAAMFTLGLSDDLFDMDPQHKLAGQIVIASLLVFFGFRLGWTDSRTINLFLSIFWLVGITNAFNLLDNMDGLAAGIAFIAGGFLFAYHYLNPGFSIFTGPVLLASAAYLGGILGFLVYNFNPASIFMGDAGSLFIGFMLAGLTVIGSPPDLPDGSILNLTSVVAVPILILFIPIVDTGFVSLMRKLFNRRISEGGRDHSSHRMVAIGFSERKAVLILYFFAAISGLIALAINRFSVGTSLLLVVLYLLLVIFFWIYLGKVKVYPGKSILSEESHGVLTPVLVEITYRRRLFEVFLDFVLIAVAYYAAYLLRFEGKLGGDFPFFLKSLPVVIACQILCFYLFGVYRGVWESTGLSDLMVYAKAIVAGSLIPMLILLFAYRFQSFSRAVFVIHGGLLLILVSLSRLSFRLLDEGVARRNHKGKPALIYGAGVGGQLTLREIESNRNLGLSFVGFIDDNPRLQGRKIKGYPVLGGYTDLARLIQKHDIREVIVSFKENGTEKKREIKNLCLKMGAEVDVKQMQLTIT
jgi:UDP-GlcNAc:undecaprenyl-phosphate GlcNAc-1-phosphate transferase